MEAGLSPARRVVVASEPCASGDQGGARRERPRRGERGVGVEIVGGRPAPPASEDVERASVAGVQLWPCRAPAAPRRGGRRRALPRPAPRRSPACSGWPAPSAGSPRATSRRPPRSGGRGAWRAWLSGRRGARARGGRCPGRRSGRGPPRRRRRARRACPRRGGAGAGARRCRGGGRRARTRRRRARRRGGQTWRAAATRRGRGAPGGREEAKMVTAAKGIMGRGESRRRRPRRVRARPWP